MKHGVVEVKLANGARGLFINVPGATVMCYELNFRAGEYLVPREKWEVPHLLEHVLLGANEKFTKARLFQAEVEKNGAYANASTGIVSIGYEAECADFEWQRILELLLLAIAKPLFLREEYRAEYGNIRDELTARSNNHFRMLQASISEAHGLIAMTDRERIKQMKNVRRQDLIDHYMRTHVTANLRFVIAGNLNGRRKTISRILESIELPKRGKRFELPPERPMNLNNPIFILRPAVRNLYFGLNTFKLARLEDPEVDAMELVNSMLTATLHSRILGEARERGLVYSMDSGLDIARNFSGWWFSAQVLPRNAKPLFEIITGELKRVRAGDISNEDLEAAKQYLLGRHQRSAQTVAGTAAGYASRYYFDGVINDYDRIPKRIAAVTRRRAVDSAESLFTDRIKGLGFLGGSTSRKLTEPLQELVQPLWQ